MTSSTDDVYKEVRSKVLQRINAKDLNIPMLPDVAMRIMQVAGDPMATTKQVAKLFKHDQQLAGKLIQIANSPVFSGGVRIESLERAVLQVGIKAVRDLVVGVVLGATLFRNRWYQDRMRQMWMHSMAVGHIAQRLAMEFSIMEDAFLAGLMHDVGKTLLLDVISDVSLSHEKKFSESFIEELLAQNHETVGGIMAEKWAFPTITKDAIRFHHQSEQAGAARSLASLIRVADLLHYETGIHCEKREVVWGSVPCAEDLCAGAVAKLDKITDQLKVDLPPFLAVFA